MALGSFARNVVSARSSVPPGVVGPSGAASVRRFSVYRNNVVSTIVEALGKSFPTCREIVGEDFFDATAAEFHRLHPPTSPILFRYGAEFADFLEDFPPAFTVPYLADVARLEWLRLQSMHARDADPCTIQTLSAYAPGDLMDVRIDIHPALSLLHSPWPVVSILAAVQRGEDLSGIGFEVGEDALVTRPDVLVETRALPSGGLPFLAALQEGLTLADAAEAGGAEAGFDLQANIAGMFKVGAATGVTL